MQTSISWVGAGIATVALSLGTIAQAAELALDKLPKSVAETVAARFADAKLLAAAEEKNAEGKQIYEVSLDRGGLNIDATLTPDGALTLIEQEVTRKDLPELIAKTLEDKYPKARYRLSEQVINVKDKEETLAHYEVLLVTPQKQIRAVEVGLDGKILKIEKKTSETEED